MSAANNNPELLPGSADETDELTHYLEYAIRVRQSTEAIQKEFGLNWISAKELEQRVIDAIPVDGIQFESKGKSYKIFTTEKRQFAIHGDAKPISTTKRVQIHSI